jgi:hypothetical protein
MKIKKVSELLEMVNEIIDERNEYIRIGFYSFRPSNVLKEMDPIAYRETVLDIADAEGIDIDELEEDIDF